MDDGFKEFFSAFRKQVDKSKAIRLYQNALESGVSASTLLSSAKRYMVSVEGRETKFTKGPATWLEKECWTEFPIPASRPESLAAVETWILSQFGALDLDWDLTPRALDFVRVNFGKMTKEEMLETVTANMADGLELGRAKK